MPAGMAGERFAVRNSGAKAVVEGIGDNGCEYMTGGSVTVLGQIGVNFGAGMTGGFAFILDENSIAEGRTNPELVDVIAIEDQPVLQEHLRGIITAHYEETGSRRANQILSGFEYYATLFKLIKPQTTDLNTLFGHRGRAPRETLSTVQ